MLIAQVEKGDRLSSHEWFRVTQHMIDDFARATKDYQWIHTDANRCKAESPFETTIAQGFLTTSLMPYEDLVHQAFRINSTCRVS